MKTCPKCGNSHDKVGTFCSRKCSNSRVFSDESRKLKSDRLKAYFADESKIQESKDRATRLWQSEDFRLKMAEKWLNKHAAKGWSLESKEKYRKSMGKLTKKYTKTSPESLYDLSTRTRTKILKRLKLSCFNCGWDEASCDTHHIVPRSKGGTDVHSNLTYLCPNCHRLAHVGKLDVSGLKSFEDILKDKWRDFYYG